jgi:hypothetical protein
MAFMAARESLAAEIDGEEGRQGNSWVSVADIDSEGFSYSSRARANDSSERRSR